MACKAKYSCADIKESIFAEQIPFCKKLVQKEVKIESVPIPTNPILKDESTVPNKLENEIFSSSKTPEITEFKISKPLCGPVQMQESPCGGVIKPDIVFFGESLPKVSCTII